MNPDIRAIVLSVVSNVLTFFLTSPFSKNQEKQISIDGIVRGAINDVSDSFEWNGAQRLEEVCLFLTTPEAEAIVRQVFAVRVIDTNKDQVDLIREEFLSLFARYFDLRKNEVKASAARVFDLLLESTTQALAKATESGVLAAHEALSAGRWRELHGEIAAIQKNITFLSSKQRSSWQDIQAFEEKYRSQVAERHGRITPPNFDSARKLPIDEIYVAPHFLQFRTPNERARQEESEHLVLSQFLSGIHRAILLGNPGGGKSTLKDKICFDLAFRYSDRLLANRTLTPVPVILRDYGAEKKLRRCSILQFIESTANSSYQLQAPPGAFEYLLLNGRLIVIFDGLDELLDTSYRQQITADVESFCNLYPSVPILVTSREVGYEQAPLDEKKFVAYKLAAFNDDQISEYVTKWFLADKDLNPTQRQQKTQSFLQESSIVPDLRSNPLMLALMCNIYRGENYIPQNRPDLYEKCAVMLFERWDKNRGIIVPLPFEAHIKPAMMFLAHWIYTNDALQSGVDERSLINKTTDYLLERRYDDRDEAEFAAREFIGFCKGRAWVFTDTGAGLYQFTHRTFLEYFTAFHLVRKYSTPAALLDVLLDRIGRREWDIVAQLSVQLLNKHSEGAGDEILTTLIQTAKASTVTDANSWNLIHFSCRCLGFIVPSSRVRKLIATACLERLIELGKLRSGMKSRVRPRGRYTDDEEKLESLGALLNVSSENQPTILRLLEDWLKTTVIGTAGIESALAVEILAYLPFVLRLPHFEEPKRELQDLWKDISEQIYDSCRVQIHRLAEHDVVVCNIVFWRREIEITEFIARFGVESLFCEIPYRLLPLTAPPGPQLLGSVIYGGIYSHIPNRSSSELRNYDHRQLAKLGASVIDAPRPWVSAGDEVYDVRSYLMDRHYSETIPMESQTVFGALAVLAVGIERVSQNRKSDLRQVLDKNDSSLFKLIRSPLLARLGLGSVTSVEELNRIGFDKKQTDLAVRWSRHEVDFVERPQRGSSKTSKRRG